VLRRVEGRFAFFPARVPGARKTALKTTNSASVLASEGGLDCANVAK
jgi:hypothetical protein